jgi:hypothetical protein
LVASQRSTTWNVQAQVTSARATTWNVAAATIAPDTNPITFTVRDTGHTATAGPPSASATGAVLPTRATIRPATHATARSSASATVRENR